MLATSARVALPKKISECLLFKPLVLFLGHLLLECLGHFLFNFRFSFTLLIVSVTHVSVTMTLLALLVTFLFSILSILFAFSSTFVSFGLAL